jgi:hypothetical protein
MHYIDGSDVRDAGPADECEDIDERECPKHEGNTQESAFSAHDTAFSWRRAGHHNLKEGNDAAGGPTEEFRRGWWR